jgi:transcriptional regulator with XRE-family HTH domain
MPRRGPRNITHVEKPAPLPPDAPRDAVKNYFARKLQQLIWDKNWSQSDLMRALQAELGSKESIGRDSISNYIRGVALPTGSRLQAIAKVFNVDPKDLIPAAGRRVAGDRSAPMEVKQLDDGNTWLRINQAVDYKTAMQILGLLTPKADEDK